MAENKTKQTDDSVEHYLSSIADVKRRRDCEMLAKIMSKATKQKPKMWGSAIVGFGNVHYKYESGREGETFLIGFSSRKSDITVYGTGSAPSREELLPMLGNHKTGKGCLYIRDLQDIDVTVLGRLLAESISAKKK